MDCVECMNEKQTKSKNKSTATWLYVTIALAVFVSLAPKGAHKKFPKIYDVHYRGGKGNRITFLSLYPKRMKVFFKNLELPNKLQGCVIHRIKV